jgi:hypothetical protein
MVILAVQIAVLEEQKIEDLENEAAEKVDDDDDDKQIDIDSNATESTAKVEVLDEKPDINDVPMEESQVNWIHISFLFCISSFMV